MKPVAPVSATFIGSSGVSGLFAAAATRNRLTVIKMECGESVAVYPATLCAASSITFVTASGCEIIERCPALTSVIWA